MRKLALTEMQVTFMPNSVTTFQNTAIQQHGFLVLERKHILGKLSFIPRTPPSPGEAMLQKGLL